MIRKSEVTVKARYNGDSLRYSQGESPGSSTKPFDFSEAAEGRVSAEAETDFRFSGIMPIGHPSASHTLLLNSWDHHELPLDKLPETKLAMTLAARGLPANLKSRLQNAEKLLTDLKSVLSDFASMFQPSGGLGGLQSVISSANVLGSFGGSDGAKNLAVSMIEQQFPMATQVIQLWNLFEGSRERVNNDAAAKKEEGKQAADKLKAASKQLESSFDDVNAQIEKLNAALKSDTLTTEEKAKEVDSIQKEIDLSLAKIDNLIASDSDGTLKKYLNAAIKDIYLSELDKTISALGLPQELENAMRQQLQEVAEQGLEKWKSNMEQSIKNLKQAIEDGDEKKIGEAQRVVGLNLSQMKRIVQRAAKMASAAG